MFAAAAAAAATSPSSSHTEHSSGGSSSSGSSSSSAPSPPACRPLSPLSSPHPSQTVRRSRSKSGGVGGGSRARGLGLALLLPPPQEHRAGGTAGEALTLSSLSLPLLLLLPPPPGITQASPSQAAALVAMMMMSRTQPLGGGGGVCKERKEGGGVVTEGVTGRGREGKDRAGGRGRKKKENVFLPPLPIRRFGRGRRARAGSSPGWGSGESMTRSVGTVTWVRGKREGRRGGVPMSWMVKEGVAFLSLVGQEWLGEGRLFESVSAVTRDWQRLRHFAGFLVCFFFPFRPPFHILQWRRRRHPAPPPIFWSCPEHYLNKITLYSPIWTRILHLSCGSGI
ncbi:uncharacterized protein ACOB8E_023593 [Sarcophilus harrisii]